MVFLFACNSTENTESSESEEVQYLSANTNIDQKLNEYKEVILQADLNHLSENQKKMVAKLIDASEIMDNLFWKQSYGDKSDLMAQIGDENLKRYVEINYGPWDRLNGDASFINGIGEKPKGANFYPQDMTQEEFEAFEDESKSGLYTVVLREGEELKTIAYHEHYKAELEKASAMLLDAAELAESDAFKNYLTLRSKALLNSEYRESDMAWMDMKDNSIDLVYGPIENYEDQMFNYKTAFEAYVLIKDIEWSDKLSKYIAFLPELQENLPVEDKYKSEQPGTDSDLNAYDVVYYAGNCNSGGKTIAINLPNDEEVQLSKGTRRLQLKNAMKAKFDEILIPISGVLIDSSQVQNITFDAFFANTMFHEVAHGLGIKNTITGNGTVRKALKDLASGIEEGKADILGLYMVQSLHEKGELPDAELMDYYVTFMAGIFRSIRFGSTSAHGIANLIRYNYFKEMNAFSFNSETGRYSVIPENFDAAIESLSRRIIEIQGNGDYEETKAFVEKYTIKDDQLIADLEKVNSAGIPKDIVFKQGKEVLGL